jgi:hypothetical protein
VLRISKGFSPCLSIFRLPPLIIPPFLFPGMDLSPLWTILSPGFYHSSLFLLLVSVIWHRHSFRLLLHFFIRHMVLCL